MSKLKKVCAVLCLHICAFGITNANISNIRVFLKQVTAKYGVNYEWSVLICALCCLSIWVLFLKKVQIQQKYVGCLKVLKNLKILEHLAVGNSGYLEKMALNKEIIKKVTYILRWLLPTIPSVGVPAILNSAFKNTQNKCESIEILEEDICHCKRGYLWLCII